MAEEDAVEQRSVEIRMQVENLLAELREECGWPVMDIEDWIGGIMEGMLDEERDEQG